MPKTEKLGLELTTDDSTTFLDWRKSVNGENDGESVDLSNAQILDLQVGIIKDKLALLPRVSPINLNLPIPIKTGTKIHFSGSSGGNILFNMQVCNSVNGRDTFPSIKIPYGGSWLFYYNGSSYFTVVSGWNGPFADSFSNEYIDWNKDTQILTYLGASESSFDMTASNSQLYPDVYNSPSPAWDGYGEELSIIADWQLTKEEFNETVGDIEAALDAILGV